ncbi:hypothetical protein C0993_007889 [Termitomyces sp. T159_Od127]|nr:hypothetical protein C0993_007889 [Termitomyces sp. T159_Od127]
MGSVHGTLKMEASQQHDRHSFEALKAQLRMIEELAREKEIALESAKKEIEELIVKLSVTCDEKLKLQEQLEETNNVLDERNKQLEELIENYLQQAISVDGSSEYMTIKEPVSKLNGTDKDVIYVPPLVSMIVANDFDLEDALRRANTDADAGLD